MTENNYSDIRVDISPLSRLSDQELWEKLRTGDQHAFNFIYARYFPLLFGYSLQFCQDKALVKDVIQDLFVGLWNKRESSAEVIVIKPYLYTILRNRIIKEITRKKHSLFRWEIPDNYNFEVSFSHEMLLINSQTAQEQVQELLKAFGNLSKRQKEAIYLRFYENMDYKDIAAVMSIGNVKSARNLVYRAIEELKQSMKDNRGLHLPVLLLLLLNASIGFIAKGPA